MRNGAAPLIFANSFMTNTAYYYGGGLYMDRSAPTVTGNSFQFNIADTGAGVYVDRSTPTIARNNMSTTMPHTTAAGCIFTTPRRWSDNNTLVQNTAIIGGGGLGIDGHSWRKWSTT